MKYFKVIKEFNHTPEDKRGIIQYLYHKNMKISNICKELNVSRPTVYRWISREYVASKKRQRKFKLNLEHCDFMVKEAANAFGIKNGTSARGMQSKILNHFGVKVCASTIITNLNWLLIKQRKPIKTFFLSNQHKNKRKPFAVIIKGNRYYRYYRYDRYDRQIDRINTIDRYDGYDRQIDRMNKIDRYDG